MVYIGETIYCAVHGTAIAVHRSHRRYRRPLTLTLSHLLTMSTPEYCLTKRQVIFFAILFLN